MMIAMMVPLVFKFIIDYVVLGSWFVRVRNYFATWFKSKGE